MICGSGRSGATCAGERQHVQHHAEHEQQDQPPEEFRDRQQQDRDEVGDGFEQRAAQMEQAEAAADAENRGERPWRRRASSIVTGSVLADQRSGLAAKCDRAAEIAVQRVRRARSHIARGSGRSSPISWRLASISSIVALGGSDIAAGSTGSSRSTQNNSAETTSRIGIAASRRRAISLSDTVAQSWSGSRL